MPRLTIPIRTTGKAVGYLLKLYKKEPGFAEELEKLQTLYISIVKEWLNKSVPEWVKVRDALWSYDLQKVTDYLLGQKTSVLARVFHKLEFLLLNPAQDLPRELHGYEKALYDLASGWKLKAPWVGRVLILDHTYAIIGITREDIWTAEAQIQIAETLLPSPPLPPLIFEVTAYELLFSGRQEIQKSFTKRLADYEKKLKSRGWEELPSSLDIHAIWWFEHYVYNRTYKQLENRYPSANAESIKRAVWNFNKLLGIKVR